MIPKNCPYSIKISSSSPVGREIMPRGNGKEELIIQLSPDGIKSAIYSAPSGFASFEKLVFICCRHMFELGEDVSLPFDFTFAAEDFANNFGRRVFRYYSSQSTAEDYKARKLAKSQNFTLDGLYLAAKVIEIICNRNISLKEALEEIPDFYTANRFIDSCFVGDNFEMPRFKKSKTPDGTVFSGAKKRIIVKPSASGRGMWLKAESTSMEAAAELCGEFEEAIREMK